MVTMYYKLVLAHKRTCNEDNKDVILVPANLRANVLKMLADNGYDADGNAV